MPAKVLRSFALGTQPHQNIGNRSHEQINDTNKQANSYVHPPQSWTWQFKHCICYKFFIFLTNYFVMVLTICGKWLGWHIIQRLTSRWSNEHFLYLLITFFVVFHVNINLSFAFSRDVSSGRLWRRKHSRNKTEGPQLLKRTAD